jgi:ubiquinone/menaquinone biosynthesis C-methylase UbiE
MSIIINDKAYWLNFYNNAMKINTPSPFAQFLIENDILKETKLIVELGCGNGRDSVFFAKNDKQVIAIDQCENTTEKLNQIKNIESFSSDFTRLPSFSDRPLAIDTVYSRFTMHSVNLDGEDRTLDWIFDNLKSQGLFCVEARTIKDDICGKGEDKGNNIWFYNGHHRRFIEADVFKEKLKTIGFEIVYFEEQKGFAKYKDSDPIVLRAIVKKP